jgi:hypothetical protein
MRPHLVSIIENGEHTTKFPEFVFAGRELSTIKTAVPVFCYCRKRADEGQMVQCMRCFEWFHKKCSKTSIDKISEFYCAYCYERRHRILYK